MARSIKRRPFLVWSVDMDEPTRLSPVRLLEHLENSRNWPEASLHRGPYDFPRLGIEFHGSAGFSLLCFENEASLGYLAASGLLLSPPSVLVCLGGQVIEKWPKELFLSATETKRVLQDFDQTGKQSESVRWVRLDRFRRITVHPGGRGLIPLWDKLRAAPGFPFA